jgi:hypothetical protein
MNMHTAKLAVKSFHEEDTPGERDFLLTALRAAAIRSRLVSTEIESIGLSLRHRKVSCAQALEWLGEENLLGWVRLGPEAKQ